MLIKTIVVIEFDWGGGQEWRQHIVCGNQTLSQEMGWQNQGKPLINQFLLRQTPIQPRKDLRTPLLQTCLIQVLRDNGSVIWVVEMGLLRIKLETTLQMDLNCPLINIIADPSLHTGLSITFLNEHIKHSLKPDSPCRQRSYFSSYLRIH